MSEYLPEIFVGLAISAGVGTGFYFLNKRATKGQDEILGEIARTVEGITNKLMEISKEKQEFVPASEEETTPSVTVDDQSKEYQRMAKKCHKLLEDNRWKWRSDVILIRDSGMTEEQLDHYVRTTPGVVRSKIPDINGNRLFSLKNKL